VSLILPFHQLFSRRRAAAATTLLLCAIALMMSVGAHAANVNVAVAANFTEPAKEIARLFEKARPKIVRS
jgi:ABC-type molybdate transport system substrate-binding protein